MTREQGKGGVEPWGELPGSQGQGPTLKAQQEALVLAPGTLHKAYPNLDGVRGQPASHLPVHRPQHIRK